MLTCMTVFAIYFYMTEASSENYAKLSICKLYNFDYFLLLHVFFFSFLICCKTSDVLCYDLVHLNFFLKNEISLVFHFFFLTSQGLYF